MTHRHRIIEQRSHMYDCNLDDEETTNEIEMYQHTVEVEAPTSGLEDIVDWDELEAGLNSGLIGSHAEFRSVVRKMYEEKEVEFPRRTDGGIYGYTYVLIAQGLFPECREILTSLPAKRAGEAAA